MASVATTKQLKELTREMCDTFRSNKHVNPLTKRTIKPTGPTATAILDYCDARFPANSKSKTASRSSSKSPKPSTRATTRNMARKVKNEELPGPSSFHVPFQPKTGPRRNMTTMAPPTASTSTSRSSTRSSSPRPRPRPAALDAAAFAARVAARRTGVPSELLLMASKLPLPSATRRSS